MKTRSIFILVVSILLLAMSACGSLGAPTATVTAVPPTEKLPTATLAPLPTGVPTPSEMTPPTTEPPTATPLMIESHLAAPANFHAGDPIQLDEIHMISSTEGWGISGAYVLATADGGQTWREATPPETLPAGAQAEVFGAFLDKQTAWVIFSVDNHIRPEASVWHTTDGGRTWTPSTPLFHQAYGDSLWAEFAVLDAKHAWLMVRGVYVGAGTHYTAQLLRTVDGGLTWTTPFNGDVNWDYTGMVFADASNGWLTWQTTSAYASAPPKYAVTTDGGLNWESRELPPPTNAPGLFDQYPYCEPFQPNLLSSRSIRLLVGCFDYHYPPEEFTSYLYASENGGTSWVITQLPEAVLASDDTLIFFDASHALLLGRDIYRSDDGGNTWPQVKIVNWDGQFSFVDAQHGWAVARNNNEIALVSTVNGGGTWTQIMPTIAK